MGLVAELIQGPSATIKAQVEERLGEEVLAAGHLRQGRTPSIMAMVTGTALIEVLRSRRSKSLPKAFVLAVTASRVIAIRGIAVGDEYGDLDGVIVRGEELGTWARDQVAVVDLGQPRSDDATLELAGERIPVTRSNDRETKELVELLSR